MIDAQISAAVYPRHAPARWALPLLDQLQRLASGWQLVELDESEMSSLWLPPHAGEACHGDSMQLGATADGGTVEMTGAWLAANGAAYATANPSCWGRITFASGTAMSPIVVSSVGVGDRTKPDHARLVVVDGFHRVLGYWAGGRRRCEAYLPVLRAG